MNIKRLEEISDRLESVQDANRRLLPSGCTQIPWHRCMSAYGCFADHVQDDLAFLIEQVSVLYEALQHTEAQLSLLRHRGGVRWGSPGIGEMWEVDEVIGAARRALYQKDSSH